MMKKYLLAALVAVSASSVSAQEFSSTVKTTADRDKASLKYKIGNGVSYFNRRKDSEFSIDAPTIRWNVNASCSGWDAGLSVSNVLGDIEGQFQKLQVTVVNSITGFVTQLPMLILQREDPGLYEMISSTILNGEELFNLKVQSCEAMSERFANSDNPLGELSDQSFWYEFSSAFDSSNKENTDIMTTMDDAEANKGENGVTTIEGNGNCGGDGQEKCNPVTDVIHYGFGKLFKGALTGQDANQYSNNSYAGGSYSVSLKPWVAQVWNDTDEAEAWIKRVIGTVSYATCESCDQMEIEAGEGVYTDIANEASEVYGLLLEQTESTSIPNRGVLQNLSSNDIFIDTSVIEALRAERSAQETFIRRISEEVGLLRVVDKLLASRRVLLVGSADPYFQSVSMNVEIIDKKLDLIADEIQMLSQELQLKRLARGDAIETLLSRHESRKRIGETQTTDKEASEVRKQIDRVNG